MRWQPLYFGSLWANQYSDVMKRQHLPDARGVLQAPPGVGGEYEIPPDFELEVRLERTAMNLLESACNALEQVRLNRPLVHNITNYVVMNFTANALLAVGASPVMAHAREEVEDMVRLAGALIINIGTLSTPWIESMFKAGRAAAASSVPIVLDPVGSGATRFRTETARRMLEELPVSVVRGNASEIISLGGAAGGARGVDSIHSADDARAAAEHLARSSSVVVAVTGVEDLVTDGVRTVRIGNGHALMGRVTGTGCAASALCAAFCAVERDPFTAVTGALLTFGIAGELAAAPGPRPGTFQVLLLDALDEIDRALLTRHARIGV